MITSSHNPCNWNGVKFKGKFGGSATPAIMKRIEEELSAGAMPQGSKAAVEEADLKTPYIAAVCRFADMDLIGKTKIQVRYRLDVRSGRGVLAGIFQDRGVPFVAIRQEVNPLFLALIPSRSSRTSLFFRKQW